MKVLMCLGLLIWEIIGAPVLNLIMLSLHSRGMTTVTTHSHYLFDRMNNSIAISNMYDIVKMAIKRLNIDMMHLYFNVFFFCYSHVIIFSPWGIAT